MTRIIIADSEGQQREVDQSAYNAGFFPGWAYVGPAPTGSPTGYDTYMDAAVAAVVGSSSSSTSGALRAAYVPPTARGARIVWLGDSVTQGATDNVNQNLGQSYPLMAQLLLGGKGMTVRNAGVAGNQSSDMLARFDTDVTPYKPNVVPLLAGTNDIGNGVAFATFQSNIQSLVGKIRGLGATPVLCTIPPNNDTTRLAKISLWNKWLARYAASIGAPFINLHKPLTDPATGTYLSANTSDGTHPSAAGQLLMGQAAASVLSTFLNPWSVPLVDNQADANQILGTNPLLITAGTGGLPHDWGSYGGGGTTFSQVTDSNVVGKMVQIARSAASDVEVVERSITTGYSVGDTLAFAGVITSDGTLPVDIKLDFIGASKSAHPANFTGAVTRGVWYGEFVVPSGTTQINIDIIVGAGGGTGQTGTASFGQPTLINLTALGLS